MEFATGIWDDDLETPAHWAAAAELAGFRGIRAQRLPRPDGARLGAGVWELDPGATQAPYHFHHGTEEMILVLRGRPTLRTPDGERELAEGETVHFPCGAAGAHQVVNRTDEVVRYLLVSASSLPAPEIVEYPDSGKLAVMSRTESQTGGPLFSMHRLADGGVDYFEGESPANSPAR